MVLLPAIIKSFFDMPYSTHRERPKIKDIINHFETSSASFVLSTFLICGTVLQRVKKVANIPIKKEMYSITTSI